MSNNISEGSRLSLIDNIEYLADLLYESNYSSQPIQNNLSLKNTRNPRTVVLRFDVDYLPNAALDIANIFHERGFTGHFFIFNTRLNQNSLSLSTSSSIDFNYYAQLPHLLNKLQSLSHYVGYHNNIVDLAEHYKDDVMDIAKTEISKYIKAVSLFNPVNYIYTDHGGPRNCKGQKNNSISLHDIAQRNNFPPFLPFTKLVGKAVHSYSDGGCLISERNSNSLYFDSLLHHIRKGSSINLLIHPQYYSEKPDWILMPGPSFSIKHQYKQSKALKLPPNILHRRVLKCIPRLSKLNVINQSFKLETPPILLRAMSRSGGSLFTSMLSAHKDLFGFLEIYPSLFCLPAELQHLDNNQISIRDVLESAYEWDLNNSFDMARETNSLISNLKYSIKRRNDGHNLYLATCCKNIMTLAERFSFSGIPKIVFYRELLHLIAVLGFPIANNFDRTNLVLQLCSNLAKLNGHGQFIVKCSGSVPDYLIASPKSHVVNLFRDPYDVVCSLVSSKNFRITPEIALEKWINFADSLLNISIFSSNVSYVSFNHILSDPDPSLISIFKTLRLTNSNDDLSCSKNYLSNSNISLQNTHLAASRVKQGLLAKALHSSPLMDRLLSINLPYSVSAKAVRIYDLLLSRAINVKS